MCGHHLPTCSGQPARITGLRICKELPVDKPSHPESCSSGWVPGSGLSGWRSWGLSVSNLIRQQCQTSWALAQAFTCKPFAANQQTQLGLDSADTRYGQPPVGFSFPTVGAETGFWYLPVLAGLNKLSQGKSARPCLLCGFFPFSPVPATNQLKLAGEFWRGHCTVLISNIFLQG